jgi:hypothetical protein
MSTAPLLFALFSQRETALIWKNGHFALFSR